MTIATNVDGRQPYKIVFITLGDRVFYWLLHIVFYSHQLLSRALSSSTNVHMESGYHASRNLNTICEAAKEIVRKFRLFL